MYQYISIVCKSAAYLMRMFGLILHKSVNNISWKCNQLLKAIVPCLFFCTCLIYICITYCGKKWYHLHAMCIKIFVDWRMPPWFLKILSTGKIIAYWIWDLYILKSCIWEFSKTKESPNHWTNPFFEPFTRNTSSFSWSVTSMLW